MEYCRKLRVFVALNNTVVKSLFSLDITQSVRDSSVALPTHASYRGREWGVQVRAGVYVPAFSLGVYAGLREWSCKRYLSLVSDCQGTQGLLAVARHNTHSPGICSSFEMCFIAMGRWVLLRVLRRSSILDVPFEAPQCRCGRWRVVHCLFDCLGPRMKLLLYFISLVVVKLTMWFIEEWCLGKR